MCHERGLQQCKSLVTAPQWRRPGPSCAGWVRLAPGARWRQGPTARRPELSVCSAAGGAPEKPYLCAQRVP